MTKQTIDLHNKYNNYVQIYFIAITVTNEQNNEVNLFTLLSTFRITSL